jgi:methionyl aminopeptidase
MPSANLYSDRQIALIKEAGAVVAESIKLAGSMCRPGVTTQEINDAVAGLIQSLGGTPVFLGYAIPGLEPFPAAICSSANDVIIHGIPDTKPLADGDILSIDVGVRKGGYIADAAWTFPVGAVDAEGLALLATGERALMAGIAAVRAGGSVKDVAAAVQAVAEADNRTIVREFCGHGVGHSLHEPPSVPNYVEDRKDYAKLKPGMVFAIEPMLNEGVADIAWPKNDWIVRTKDGRRSVHFEHTVAVTKDGAEILTASV